MNSVNLMGRLGRDVELRYTSNNNAVAALSVAVEDRYRAKDGTTKKSVVWVECEAWGKVAETIARYFKKGDKILLEGRLKLDQWEQDGQKRSKLKVALNNFHFIENPKTQQAAAQAHYGGGDGPPPDDDAPPF
ncbi:MAG: single-stranded DNA-binding protein [Phycisphaerales bacterium JB064]